MDDALAKLVERFAPLSILALGGNQTQHRIRATRFYDGLTAEKNHEQE